MKRVDYLTLPVFKLGGRKEVTNLNSVRFCCQGLQLGSNSIQSKAKFESEVVVNSKKTIDNCKPLEACINLGEYLTKHSDIIKDIATNYVRYYNLDKIRNEMWSRQQFTLDGYKYFTLNDNFVSFSVSNIKKEDIFSKKKMKIGAYHDKTLIRRMTNYFKYCGVGEGEYLDLRDIQLIGTEFLLDIFDFCMEVYNDYCKLNLGELDMSIAIDLKVHFLNGIPQVDRSVRDMKSMIYLTMLSRYKGKSLNNCLYCGDLFFGRKNQLFCCPNHSDLYNGKYERRKERKKRDKETIER